MPVIRRNNKKESIKWVLEKEYQLKKGRKLTKASILLNCGMCLLLPVRCVS
jgi:hypothetical protein